ncbi:hypothetical protein LTS18_009441, partial [Coniosporium uncinatum]
MDQLPVELIHRICAYLEQTSDICNFRLVDKAFSAVGAEYLLPEAYFFVHQDSYNHLLEIARHPHIRRSVTSLWHQAQFLAPVYKNLKEFEASIDRRFDHLR